MTGQLVMGVAAGQSAVALIAAVGELVELAADLTDGQVEVDFGSPGVAD